MFIFSRKRNRVNTTKGNLGYGVSDIRVPYQIPEGKFNGIMFVAEAPGANEEEQRKPLVGTSGKKFDIWLEESKIKREECVIANTFTFRPYNNDINKFFISPKAAEKDSIPVAKWRGLCRGKYLLSHFDLEIARLYMAISKDYRPSVVVSMGGISAWALLAQDVPMAEVVGKKIVRNVSSFNSYHTVTILPTWHPTFAGVYKPEYASTMVDVFKRARKIARSKQ